MAQRFDTKTVHFQAKDVSRNMSKAQPIYQTSAFTFKDLEDMESFYKGDKEYLYSRFGNPNTDDLGKGVAAIEDAEDGVATSSGMSAILAGILAVVKPGEHVIASEDLYGGTYQLLAVELLNLGVEVSFVSFEDKEEIRTAIQSTTKLIYTESVTNPLLRVENLEMVQKLAKEFGLITMIDNTFATPFLLQPTKFGADLVIHSATKYIGGHSDVTAGVLVGKKELIEKARVKVVSLGCNLSPFEAWLACRGLKTLSIRMDRQSKNAHSLANALKTNENVTKVYYPTELSSKGNGAMVSIELNSILNVEKFFASLDWVKIAPTLAGVETTVSYPIRTSHRTIPNQIREKLGITNGLVRISVGIEDELDIIETFEAAIRSAK
ncbi:cystathionine gamma-synthase [Alkalihalophilus pseudofirmus]|nr:cystathionine gamma-synthase [Alkalihalophilus pseudofirmus]